MTPRDLKRRLEQLEARFRAPASLEAGDNQATRAQALEALEREACRLEREGKPVDGARLRGLVARGRGWADGAITDEELELWASAEQLAGRGDHAIALRAFT